jgi:hypothetical protein
MANVGVSSVKIIDNDGDSVSVNSSGRLAVETEQDDAFSSWVTFGDLAIDTSPIGNDLDTLCGTTGARVTNAKEILIQTDDANTGYVMVGENSSVAAGSVGSRRGIKLNPGETLVLALAAFQYIFLVGSTGTQYVNVSYFT